jgi:hypothetical protein|tara:strand:- start:2490 stop:3386 length:897 start_codon:yes stop_codon:yes gene_type:complete
MALPDYLQDTGKDLARQMTATYSAPLDTSTFMGSQFVAGQDPAQTAAYNLATQGVGSYAPYLQAAQAAAGTAAGTVGGLSALTGPMTGQQLTDYTSPYQGAVIDETLRQYDLSRQGGIQDIKDAAVGTGNFGGGREGAMLGQYQADTLANKAGIRAGLLQQGYGDALAQRQQNLMNQSAIAKQQLGVGQTQLGLSDFARTGMGADIQALGNLGSLNQGYQQALLNAQQQQLQSQAYEPYGRLSQYASGITGLAGGMAAPQYQDAPTQSPWQTALSTVTGLGGLYGQIFNKPSPIQIIN